MQRRIHRLVMGTIMPCLALFAGPAARAERVEYGPPPSTIESASEAVSRSTIAHSASNEEADRQLARLGDLPLSFAANCGTEYGAAEFYARGLGYSIKLAPDKAQIHVLRRYPANREDATDTRRAVERVAINFVGANRNSAGHGTQILPGTVNDLRAGSSSGRCTELSTYERVRFSAIYPGIDLLYYGNGRELEFDLVVGPSADPSAIKLAIDGADRTWVDAEGDLNIDAAGEFLVLRRPVAYQERDGWREPVATNFVLDGKHTVSLRMATYDHNRALTIDPVLTYATYLGGTKTDYGIAVVVDASGNSYVAGYTTSADFPLLTAYDKTLGTGDVDAFVTKINATGKSLVYSTLLGGSTGTDRAVGVAIDAAGNAYVTGTTTGGFPATAGAYQATSTGSDSFIAKLGPAGSTLLYASYVRGVESRGIAMDTAGNAYIAGRVVTTFNTTAGAYQQTPGGAFVLKLNATGTAASYATYLGQGGNESATSIAIDGLGNAYVAGSTDASDFPTVNALQTAKGGGKDAFIAKLNPAGSGLVYSTYLGGTLDDVVNAIAVDGDGNAYVAGETYSTDFPVRYAYMPQKPGSRLTNASLGSGFFAKITATGDGLLYSSFLGGEICTALCNFASPPAQYPGDAAYGIAVDTLGHAYITGLARSYTFPLVNSLKPAKTLDTQDSAFVAKVSRSGGTLLYSTFTRTGTSEAANSFTKFPPGSATGVATDAAGAAYVTGDADSASNFAPTTGVYQTTNGGGQGAIVIKVAGATGTITLTSSAFAVVAATPVTLTATIAGVTLTGSIVFMDGPTTVGSVAIASSKAVLTTTLGVGIHRLTAIYAGTGKELDSAVLNVVVDNALVCD